MNVSTQQMWQTFLQRRSTSTNVQGTAANRVQLNKCARHCCKEGRPQQMCQTLLQRKSNSTKFQTLLQGLAPGNPVKFAISKGEFFSGKSSQNAECRAVFSFSFSGALLVRSPTALPWPRRRDKLPFWLQALHAVFCFVWQLYLGGDSDIWVITRRTSYLLHGELGWPLRMATMIAVPFAHVS